MIQIDMQMPESCVECRFSQGGYMYCHAMPENFCGYVNYCEEDGRPEWCPLKAQEPRVLALDEMHGSMAVWLEDVDKTDVILAIAESEFYALHGLCRCFITSDNRRIAPIRREYGIRWRAWTSEPTDEQRKAVKWNDRT